jgi:hypothetical protein
VKEIILCKWSNIFCVYWQIVNMVKEFTLKINEKGSQVLKT